MQKPTESPDDAEREALLAMIETYSGNLSAMAAALGNTSHQALSRRIARFGLDETAAQARACAGIKGPRPQLESSSADPTAEHAQMVDAIARAGGYRGAAKALGISPRTMARRMVRLGIRPAHVRARRAHHKKP